LVDLALLLPVLLYRAFIYYAIAAVIVFVGIVDVFYALYKLRTQKQLGL
jgi:hypothetical protein